jgi:hypothetical protein
MNSYNIFRGYDFQRKNPHCVALWRTCACVNCCEPVVLHYRVVSEGKDSPLLQARLHKWTGSIPRGGHIPYAGGPILCGDCLQAWLEFKQDTKPTVPLGLIYV